jgi:hypothetical protein
VPADPNDKPGFISYLYNIDNSSFEDWLILGDSNLIRSPGNRSGNCNEMLLFNDVIHHLDLVEISLQGRDFT